jgi:hypothetical protein
VEVAHPGDEDLVEWNGGKCGRGLAEAVAAVFAEGVCAMSDRFTQLAERWAAENAIKNVEVIESVASLLREEVQREQATHASHVRALVESLTKTST